MWVISRSVGFIGFTIETVRELMLGSACVAGGLPLTQSRSKLSLL
jgi:hypothetical protein